MAILVIDDIDRICVKRSEYDHENVQIVSQFLTCLDGLFVSHRVLVIATSTQPYLLDTALRRAGRFDREVSILPPTQDERKEILAQYFASYGVNKCVERELDELSLLTRGFSGADLELFVQQVMITSVEESSELSFSFLLRVLGGITPSIMKNEERVTGIRWESIGGMEDVKLELHKVIPVSSM